MVNLGWPTAQCLDFPRSWPPTWQSLAEHAAKQAFSPKSHSKYHGSRTSTMRHMSLPSAVEIESCCKGRIIFVTRKHQSRTLAFEKVTLFATMHSQCRNPDLNDCTCADLMPSRLQPASNPIINHQYIEPTLPPHLIPQHRTLFTPPNPTPYDQPTLIRQPMTLSNSHHNPITSHNPNPLHTPPPTSHVRPHARNRARRWGVRQR